ncbi:MAG: zinc ribbon domain-containing protein [Ruminococcus sp.]|nr:zinc ribbon domain-containing protein [Ruminococcus sp.]
MKCTICGAEIGPNDQICNNCGTKVSEMGPAFGQSQNSYGSNTQGGYSYGNNNSYGYGSGLGDTSYNGGFGANSIPPSRSRGLMNGDTGRLIGFIVALVVVLGVLFVPKFMMKNFKIGDITVKLPMNCKETTSMFDSLTGMDGAHTYGNRDLQFCYIKYDLSDIADDMNSMSEDEIKETEEAYVQVLMAMMGTLDNYKEKSVSANRAKFSYNDSKSAKTYVDMKAVLKKDGMYLLICMCDDADSGKLSSKFNKIFDSVTFK